MSHLVFSIASKQAIDFSTSSMAAHASTDFVAGPALLLSNMKAMAQIATIPRIMKIKKTLSSSNICAPVVLVLLVGELPSQTIDLVLGRSCLCLFV
jgi:hypothetical protein